MFWNASTAIEGLVGSASVGAAASESGTEPHLIDPHRPGDVLQIALATIFKRHVELVANQPVGVIRDADAPRLRDAFKPRGDVDPVAENIAVLDHDVADMNSDAELDAFVLWYRRVAFDHAALHLYGAAHCVHRAREFDQDAVASSLDDPAAMLGDLGIEVLAPKVVDTRERAFFVGAHEPAIAGNVASKDRR